MNEGGGGTHIYGNQFLVDVPYKWKYIIITSCQLCTYGGGVSQIFFFQGGKMVKKHKETFQC